MEFNTDDFFKKIDELLEKIIAIIPEAKAVAITSSEGIPIVAKYNQEDDVEANWMPIPLELGKLIAGMNRNNRYQSSHIYPHGHLLIFHIDSKTVLVVLAEKEVRLGFILLDVRRTIARWGINGDRYPYPYIFKPPEPPAGLGAETQAQVRTPENKKLKNQAYCQYCGKELTEEELLTHNCRKQSIK